MIYRDRKYLSILTLTEDRDYVTYDELIAVLTERPSYAIYIERDGMLCGILSSRHIIKRHDGKNRHVPFNEKFTSVQPGEYLRARQIFKDNTTFKVLPVVSEDGHLLGDYVRWNDLTGTDYAELLYKDPYVLQGLKTNIRDAVFVAPTVHGGANRGGMFSRWRQKLESEGIHLQVIEQWEIKD